MARLNNTEALVAVPIDGETEHTISVRKVGNGFMTRTNRYNSRTGEYTCDEQFSKKAPRIVPPKVVGGKTGAVGSEGLSDTKRYLGEDV